MISIHITKDFTPHKNQSLKLTAINMTPAKYENEEDDFISGEMGSPVLDSTALGSLQTKSFISSTPTCNRVQPATPESKKSVRNILDQLCSPISMKGSEEWSFESPADEIEKKVAPKSSNKRNTSELPKSFSKNSNKSKTETDLKKSSLAEVNLNLTHNELFDDISDVSLQFLCEATNHLVETPKSNESIKNSYDHKGLNEGDLHCSASKKKYDLCTNLPEQKVLKYNDKKTEPSDLIMSDNSKLIYSDISFSRLKSPAFFHLNDLFSEVKCLEEANKDFKNQKANKSRQESFKAIQNKPATSNVSYKQNHFFQTSNDLASVQCELDSESKIFNDSFGISDTQFCEVVEAAELMSNLDKTLSSNINSSGKTDQNIQDIEGEHKISTGKMESCIRNIKSENSTLSLFKDIEFSTTDINPEDTKIYKGLEQFVEQTTDKCIAKNNSKTKQCELNIISTENRDSFESQIITMTKLRDTTKLLPKITDCQAQPKQPFKIPDMSLKMVKYSLSNENQGSRSNVTESFQTSKGKLCKGSEIIFEKSRKSNSKPSYSDLPKICTLVSKEKPKKTSQEILTKNIGLLDGDHCESEPVLKSFQTGSRRHHKSNIENHSTAKSLKTANVMSSMSDESLKKVKCSLAKTDNTSEFLTLGHQKQKETAWINRKVSLEDSGSECDKILEGFKIPSSSVSNKRENDLRETMLFDHQPNLPCYGFQTASGKSVKITQASLEKAKKLFDDSPKPESGLQSESGKTFQISEEPMNQIMDLFKDTPKFREEGFQTASGKTVKISEESLKKAKQLFDDGLNLSEKCFQTASGKSVQISEQSKIKAKQLFDDDPKLMGKGFQTAGGKTVKLSEESFSSVSEKTVRISKDSLKKAKQLFDDGTNIKEKCFLTTNGKSVQISEQLLEKAELFFDDGKKLDDIGFQTASGKTVQISKDSLKKAKQLLEDSPKLQSVGFQTASGETISEELLKKAKKLFDDSPKLQSVGFQTASGKKVEISEESLKKAKQVFDDSAKLSEKDFQTVSVKSEQISEQSLDRTKQLFDGNPKLMSKGFQTASGKTVKISEKSLKKARQFFDDGMKLTEEDVQTVCGKSVQIPKQSFDRTKEMFNGNPKLMGRGFQTASGKTVEISEESLNKAKQLLDDGTNPSEKCFQTASGKSVQISEHSLEKAKQLFDDRQKLQDRGFQTASGKTVKISKESLEMAKQLFDDADTSVTEKCFQTASDKLVSVSDQALEQAKELIDDPLNFKEKDFQTASLNSMQMSEESNKTYKVIKNISYEPDIPLDGYQSAFKSDGVAGGCLKSSHKSAYGPSHKPKLTFKGFKTATGKSVKVSEESLKVAKNLLDSTSLESTLYPTLATFGSKEECSIIENYGAEAVLKGFQKAGGKCVKISEIPLEKTLAQPSVSSAELKPQAFQTASGKGVNVSEESLRKVKDMFREEYSETGNNLIGFELEGTKSGKSVDEDFQINLNKSYPKIYNPVKKSINRENLDKSKATASLQVVEENNCSAHNDIAEVENVLQNREVAIHQKSGNQKRKHPFQSDCSYVGHSLNDTLSRRVMRPQSNCLSKRRKLFIENDTTNQVNEDRFVYDEQSSMIGASVISEADLSLLNHSRTSLGENETRSPELMSPGVAREVSESMAALLADEATNSPFSLKPFVSSPSMMYDRQIRLPSIDCYENEMEINNKQLSPILGSNYSLDQKKYDKHVTCGVSTPTTLLNQTNNANTKLSSFKPPYATSTPNESQVQSKRKSLYSNLYPKAEKRQKTSLSSENEKVHDISKGRSEAAEKQEQYVTEKLKKHAEIKPCKGSYLLRKQTEKSRNLRDLTRNGPLTLFSTQQLNQYGVKRYVQDLSIRNVTEFRFLAVDYFSKETASSNINGIPVGDGALLILDGEGKAGVKEVTRAFLASPSIDPSLIYNEWVENHFKWIVLKMAAMERMFPSEFGNRYLTPNNLMLQLKYRYDREIDRSQRPALRKILEKDESAAKTMVLFVADILDVDVQPDKEKHSVRQELLLSDGWYSVRATIDHEMETLIRRKKVGIGTKLMITGSELCNNEAGCHPLETPANVRLRVSTNSVRRARWFARLGFHARSPGPARLAGVFGRGGALPALTAVVVRTYPTLFLEKVNGKTVIRSERAEQTAEDQYQTKRQQCAEAILSQLQRELETSRSKKQPVTRTSIQHATSTKHLYSLLDGVDDISFLQDTLSKEQMNEIKELKEEEMRKAQQQLQDKLVDELDKKIAPRNVTRMLKVRLVDEEDQTGRSALLTVWNPSDDVMNCLTEGNLLTFFNISASGFSRFGDLQLTAGKQTKYSVQKHCSSPRRVTPLSELQNSDYKAQFSEVDVVGLVVQLTDSSPDKTSNLIYLADSNHNFIGVSFWTDLKSTGYAAALTPGSLVAASNLHWRSHLVSWRLPPAFATEMSSVSQHPRQPHLQQALAQLRGLVMATNLDRYLESCQERIKTLIAQRNNGGVQKVSTPIESTAGVRPCGSRANSGNSDLKLARDKVDLSVTENIDTPTNKRLEMLERYGEPPTISPLSTSTPTSVKRSFRPPMRKFCDKR